MTGRRAEKKPSHKPGFSFAGSVTTENFTSLTKVYRWALRLYITSKELGLCYAAVLPSFVCG